MSADEQFPGLVTVHCFYGCQHVEFTEMGKRSQAMETHYKTAHAGAAGQILADMFTRRRPS